MATATKRRATPRFFYGWVMIGIAALGSMSTSPGQTFGVSLFNPSFREALGLSHTEITAAYAVGTFFASLPQSLVGALMDRFGIRRVMIVVVIAVGLACLLASQVTNLIMLFFAFLCLRMFGQGALSLLSGNTVAMWFRRRLGTAQGILSVGFALGMGIMPPLVLWLIATLGWRAAYATLGLIVVTIMLPLLFFFYVNKPEDIGQTVDGLTEDQGVVAQGATLITAETNFTLGEAIRTRTYWILASLAFISGLISTAVYFNSLPMLESFGLAQSDIGVVLSLAGIVVGVSQLPAGFLADRVPLNWLIALAMAFFTISTALLLIISNLATAYIFAVSLGLGQAFFAATTGTAWARYFGRTNLGKIRGSVFTAGVAGTSLGPFIMGATFDLFGSYTPSIIFFIALYTPCVIAALFATQPSRPTAFAGETN